MSSTYSQYAPEALGGNSITASTIGGACLVAMGVCLVAAVLNRLNMGIISSPIGIAASAAAAYGAYYAYAYTRHTGMHTSIDNNILAPGNAHPFVYGGAVAAGLAAAYLYNGGNQVRVAPM